MSEQVDTPTEPQEPDAPEAPDTDNPEEPEEPEAFDAEAAREKLRKVNAEAANLRKRAKAAEEAAETAKGNNDKVPALEAELMRLRVAVKHGLPENVAKRLTGTTEEELLQDAEELLNLFGKKTPPTNQPRERLRGGGDPTGAADPTLDSDKFAEEVFRN